MGLKKDLKKNIIKIVLQNQLGLYYQKKKKNLWNLKIMHVN